MHDLRGVALILKVIVAGAPFSWQNSTGLVKWRHELSKVKISDAIPRLYYTT